MTHNYNYVNLLLSKVKQVLKRHKNFYKIVNRTTVTFAQNTLKTFWSNVPKT